MRSAFTEHLYSPEIINVILFLNPSAVQEGWMDFNLLNRKCPHDLRKESIGCRDSTLHRGALLPALFGE